MKPVETAGRLRRPRPVYSVLGSARGRHLPPLEHALEQDRSQRAGAPVRSTCAVLNGAPRRPRGRLVSRRGLSSTRGALRPRSLAVHAQAGGRLTPLRRRVRGGLRQHRCRHARHRRRSHRRGPRRARRRRRLLHRGARGQHQPLPLPFPAHQLVERRQRLRHHLVHVVVLVGRQAADEGARPGVPSASASYCL